MYIKFFRQTRSISKKLLTAMLIVLLTLPLIPVQPALAASIIVTNTADELTNNNGCSLREAIINANDDAATYPDCIAGSGDDVITLTSDTTYTLSLVAAGANGGDLNITDPAGLTIQASGATPAIIDANGIDRVLEVTAGNFTIDHITITNGTATQGGGIFVTTTGILTINNSSILDNTGTNAGWCGGGIYNNGAANININNSTIAGNSCIGAGSVGGGMYKRNINGQLNISNSTFYNNSAVDMGGGLTVGSGPATISFSTFSNNRATNNGGAIQVTGGNVTITSSILANSTTPVGGSINDCNQFTEFAPAPAVVTLVNSIVEVNSNCPGTVFSSNDPGLGTFQNNGGPTNTMAITATSNAYNNAASCGSLSADQRGVSRPQATSCDIGAYELDNSAPSITSFTRQNPATSPTNADTLVFRATFSEDVKNVGTADFAVNSTSTATVTSVSQVTASTYDITVSGGDLAGYNGTVNLNLSGSQDITDLAGNALPTGEPLTDETYTVNNSTPSLTSFTRQNPATSPTNADTLVFRATFSEDVKNVGTADFAVNSTSTATVTSVSQVTASTYDITVSGGDLAGYNGTVNLNLSGSQDITDLAGNALPAGEPATDETYTVDNTAPTVTINQAAPPQTDPTNSSPIDFTVVFSESVTGFTNTDISLGGSAGATTVVATEITPFNGTTYTVTVFGMTSDGLVTATVNANAATDVAGNNSTASSSTDNTVTYNTGAPDTTIDSNPTNPSNSADADFTFSSPDADVVDFECRLDSGAFAASCTSPQNYTGLSGGTHTFEVRAVDDAGNVDPTPASYTWTIDLDYPTVTSSVPTNGVTVTAGPTQLTVNFSEDVKNDGSAGAANNTANYLLVEYSVNTTFDTLTCAGGLVADDSQIAVDSASYTNNGGGGPFVATLNINGGTPIPLGTYRLFVCGTTSIEDLSDNELNNGVSDAAVTFTVAQQATSPQTAQVPKTGFSKMGVTTLPAQLPEKAYAMTDLWMEIPSLNIKTSIVGVPFTSNGWDVTWLNSNAGWLNGSAFPTWTGNSVITAHVWDALNQPGPFARLKDLRYGDQVKVHAFGQVYTYEIRETIIVSPSNITKMLKHEEKSWITLVTCENYLESTDTYLSRRIVRAVLVKITSE